MSPEQYLSGLKQLEAATNKSASKMENSFKEYGTSINKAGIAMRYVSSEMGAGAVAFGRAFQVLAGGKIAIAVAAIAGAFTALKNIWDKVTLSAEEYNQKLDITIQKSEKRLSSLRESQRDEDGMIERLQELAERENKTNEEKKEAARLAEILSGKYGKLGVSVDDLTGDYGELLKAIKAIDEAQKSERLDALAEQIANLSMKSDALAKKHIGGNWMSDTIEFFGGRSGLAEDRRNSYLKLDSSGKLAYAQKKLDTDANTEEEIRFWSEQIDTLTQIVQLEKQMDNLKKTGYETDKEELAARKAESDAAAEAQKAETEALAAYRREHQRLFEEKQKSFQATLDHARKTIQAYNDERAAEQRANQQRRKDQVESLRVAALRAKGLNEEAAIQEALYAEAKARGIGVNSLDEGTRATVTDMAVARYRLQASMQASSSPELYAPRVNSLIARGGSSAPVKMPKVEELQSRQLDATNKTNQIANRILNQMDGWNTI